jgi:hypothetical protein
LTGSGPPPMTENTQPILFAKSQTKVSNTYVTDSIALNIHQGLECGKKIPNLHGITFWRSVNFGFQRVCFSCSIFGLENGCLCEYLIANIFRLSLECSSGERLHNSQLLMFWYVFFRHLRLDKMLNFLLIELLRIDLNRLLGSRSGYQWLNLDRCFLFVHGPVVEPVSQLLRSLVSHFHLKFVMLIVIAYRFMALQCCSCLVA